MSFVYAALAFVAAGIVLALAQGLIAGGLGLRLIRVEPWRSLATLARIALSALAAWTVFDLAQASTTRPSDTACIRSIYQYADGTEGTERPSSRSNADDGVHPLAGPIELRIYPARQELVPC